MREVWKLSSFSSNPYSWRYIIFSPMNLVHSHLTKIHFVYTSSKGTKLYDLTVHWTAFFKCKVIVLLKVPLLFSPSTASVPVKCIYRNGSQKHNCAGNRNCSELFTHILYLHSLHQKSSRANARKMHCVKNKRRQCRFSARGTGWGKFSQMQLNIMRVAVGCAQLTSCNVETRSARPWFMADSAGDAALVQPLTHTLSRSRRARSLEYVHSV